MAKKTNSKISSSIRQNTAATNEGFNRLLELQQQTNINLDSIRSVLTEAIIAQKSGEIKELKSIAESIRDMVSSSMTNVSPSSSNSPTDIVTKSKEEKNEEQMSKQKSDQLLLQIEKNTRPVEMSKAKGAEKEGGGLGGWLTALAAGLGTVAGIISGHIKALKFFADILTPAFITEKLGAVIKFVDGVIDGIKGFFGIGKEGSLLTRVFDAVTSAVNKFIDPILDAFKFLKESTKIGDTIGDIFRAFGSIFSAFGDVFSKVTSIIGKVFYPLTVIMTIWDTVKGAIEGYEEEGIIGGITGAIKGFFNSLIFGPVDMIKNATAWVLGFFGFDKAEEALKSFSFQEMFNSLVNSVKDVLLRLVNGAIDRFSAIIDAYREEGIVSAIAETIKALVNTVVSAPVDLLKDGVAWILEQFGFEKAASFLKSFSVETIYSALVDAVFSPVQTFKQIMGKFGEFLDGMSDFTIPEFGFTIPFVNKKISVGPFKPFKALKGLIKSEESEKTNTETASATRISQRAVEIANELAIQYPQASKESIYNEAYTRAEREISRGASSSTSVVSSVIPPSPSTSNTVSAQTAAVTALRDQRSSAATTVIAPSVSNNMSSTQVAKIEAPVRNSDSSVDRYMASRLAYR